MDSIFAIAAGLGLRFVVDTVSHHDFKLTGTLVGLWEGVILLHFLKKMPKSSDPYIAYVVRLFVDFMVTESVTRLVLVLIWTGLGMILADITPAIWDDVGLKRVWRRFRRDLYTISRMIPTVAFFPPARTVRFSPSRAPSVIPDTERDRDTNTNAPSTFSPSVLTTDRTPTTYAPPTTTATQEIFRRRLPGHFATDFSDTDTDILSVRGRFPSTNQHDNTRTSRRLSMFPAQRDFDTPSDTSTQNELDEDNLSSHSSHSTERGGPTTSTDLLIDTTQIPDMEVEEEPLVEVAAAVAAVPEKDEAGDVTPRQPNPMFLPPTPSDSAALFLDRDEPPFTGPDPEHLPQIPDFLEEPVSEDWEKIKKEEADPFYTGNDEKPPTPPAKEYPPGFNPIPVAPSTDVPPAQTEADTAAGQPASILDEGWDTLESQFLSKPNVDDPYTNDATTHGEAPFNFNDPPHRPISQPPAYMESYDNNEEFNDIYGDEPDKSFGQDVAGSSFDPAVATAEEEKRAREEQERIVKEAEDVQRQIEEEIKRQADERRRREEEDRVAAAATAVAAAAQETMQKEAEEEAKRKLEEEATRKKQADAAERRRKEEEDATLRLKKREEEAEAEKKRVEEEEKAAERKRLEDAENERLAEEAEKKRIEDEEADAVRIAAEEAELKRLEEEEEAEKLKKEEAKAARKVAKEAAKEQKRLEAEAEQKRIEEEERVKKEAEEAEKAEKAVKRAAKKKRQEEEQAKKEMERLEAERVEQERLEEERLQQELQESRLAEEERQRLEAEEASRLAAEQEVDDAAAHQPGEEESRGQQEEEAKVEDDEAKKAQGEPERQPEEESTAPAIFDDPELTKDALAAQIFALGTLRTDDEPMPADDTNTPTLRDVQLPPDPTNAPEQLVDVEPTGENGVNDADLQQHQEDLMETESVITAASGIPEKSADRLERQLLLKAQMVDVEALISDLITQKEGAESDRAIQIEQELRANEKVLRKMKRKEQRRWDDRKHHLSSMCSHC